MGPFERFTLPYYHPGPWRVSDLIMELGSTRKVAEELGVSQRQVQRYLLYERGITDKQARSTRRIQPRLNEVGERLNRPPSARGKNEVVIIVTGRVRVRSSKRRKQDDERVRMIDWPITDGEWRQLVRMANVQGEQAASDYFFEDLYGVAGMSLVQGVVEGG